MFDFFHAAPGNACTVRLFRRARLPSGTRLGSTRKNRDQVATSLTDQLNITPSRYPAYATLFYTCSCPTSPSEPVEIMLDSPTMHETPIFCE